MSFSRLMRAAECLILLAAYFSTSDFQYTFVLVICQPFQEAELRWYFPLRCRQCCCKTIKNSNDTDRWKFWCGSPELVFSYKQAGTLKSIFLDNYDANKKIKTSGAYTDLMLKTFQEIIRIVIQSLFRGGNEAKRHTLSAIFLSCV